MSGSESFSRRAFVTAAAAAAAVPVAASAAGCDSGGGQAAPARTRPSQRRAVMPENAKPGDPHWWIRNVGAPDAIMGYAAQSSVLPDEPIHLYVSTTAREFTVRAYRMGWYAGDLARLVWQSGPVRGHRQRPAARSALTNTVHTDWGISLAITATAAWPEGAYLLRLDGSNGAQRYVPITVRSASTAGKVVLKNGVSTWQAYNTWGEYDLYQGPGGGYADRSLVVSLDRPYDREGAYLFMVYERKLINLAERIGIPLAYLTSIDLATDPRILAGASALISPGHDEYWTPAERANVTAARDAGVNLAFLGANAMFRRIRLEHSPIGPNRKVVCYKTSYREDPLYGKDNALVTNDFREPPSPDPESSVTGTLYESYPAVADYVVATPDAWLFAGTGARKGTRFRSLIGIEYDRVNPAYPLERPIQVLSHSPLTCHGVNSYADSAYYTHHGGAGVFNAGTMRWVESFGPPLYHWGITKACGRFTRRVTENVLQAFADGPAAEKYPARDNLSHIRAWPGNPIAAGHNLWPPVVL